MNTKEKLLKLIEQYISEYKNLLEKYHQGQISRTLYEELIKLLNEESLEENKLSISILLNTIYEDNIYVDEFYYLIYKNNQEELKQFIEKMVKEYNNLKEKNENLNMRINRNNKMYMSAKRVRACIRYQTPISNSKNDINNTKRIISYYETSGIITNKEEILLINEIELHNRKVISNRKINVKEKEYTEKLYNEIPNILNIGFQEHDVIEISKDRKNSLDKFVTEIINLINYTNKSDINELLESYQKYNLEYNEYNYIITRILDAYLEELITLYELLIDKDIYSHRVERNDVIRNYYLTLEKYLIIRNYYEKITEYTTNDEIVEETNIETSFVQDNERKLIYSRSEINITKAKIISDMSNISYEYYDEIYNLIAKFKDGTLGNKKIKPIKVGNKSQGHIELKDDNARVILKRVRENIYNVLGVLIKKATNDMGGYRTITNRITPNVNTEELLAHQLELSELTEKELLKLVQDKARKNGRK